MKIEKISENQVKFTLSKADLVDRNIKLDELSTSSEKTQELFRDIMEQAFEECDFDVQDVPVMVEAVPAAVDGIMIIVTKLSEDEIQENKANLISQNKEARRYKRKSLDMMDDINEDSGEITIYSFDDIDSIIEVSKRINSDFYGTSAVYKEKGRYYLVLQYDETVCEKTNEEFEVVLSEYGRKHFSSLLSKYYLVEHGEVILQNHAVGILARYFEE